MGYGKNLKAALDEKNMTVKELSRLSNISATTLYSIIQRDSAVRYDTALRISNILDIDINTICKDNPYKDASSELPEMIPEMNGLLTTSNINTYLKHRTMPILKLLGYNELPNIDRILAAYYSLDDEGREQIFDTLEVLAKRHSDPERTQKLKEIN